MAEDPFNGSEIDLSLGALLSPIVVAVFGKKGFLANGGVPFAVDNGTIGGLVAAVESDVAEEPFNGNETDLGLELLLSSVETLVPGENGFLTNVGVLLFAVDNGTIGGRVTAADSEDEDPFNGIDKVLASETLLFSIEVV